LPYRLITERVATVHDTLDAAEEAGHPIPPDTVKLLAAWAAGRVSIEALGDAAADLVRYQRHP